MQHSQDIANWTAALSAATAAGFVVAILIRPDSPSYVFVAAEVAATVGVAALLLSLFALRLPVWSQLRHELAQWYVGARGRPGGGAAADSDKRLEILNSRLDIDDSRLCTQYLIPCTCWSLCAGPGDKRTDTATGIAPRGPCAGKPLPEEQDLPLVHRSGMDSCPFRFVAPIALRSIPAPGQARNGKVGVIP